MSYSNKKKLPVKDEISTAKFENNSSDMFEFYAQIVQKKILRNDDADGK